jgi:hypothetical protein
MFNEMTSAEMAGNNGGHVRGAGGGSRQNEFLQKRDDAPVPVQTIYGAIISDRVAIPKPLEFGGYTARPVNTCAESKSAFTKESTKGKLVKRMIQTARPHRKNDRAVGMSIEGRGS